MNYIFEYESKDDVGIVLEKFPPFYRWLKAIGVDDYAIQFRSLSRSIKHGNLHLSVTNLMEGSDSYTYANSPCQGLQMAISLTHLPFAPLRTYLNPCKEI